MLARGENKPSFGVGGDSMKRIPEMTSGNSCIGLLVMVSALGDSKASSSGYSGERATVVSA